MEIFEYFWLYAIAIFMVLIAWLAVKYKKLKTKEDALNKAKRTWYENTGKIKRGMSSNEVVELIGDHCLKSFFEDGTELWEWRIQQPGYSQIYNGSEFSLKVKFKNDAVVEVIFDNHLV